MCSEEGGCVAAGQHATVAAEQGDCPGLRVTVALPFRLDSMAEAELDISPACILLRGPASAGADAEVHVPLPEGFRLDPDRAAARFSKKKQQLVVLSPNTAPGVQAGAPAPTPSPSAAAAAEPRAAAPGPTVAEEPAAAVAQASESAASSPAAAPAPAPSAPAAAAGEPRAAAPVPAPAEDEDEDDLPPPLEAARSIPRAEGATAPAVASQDVGRGAADMAEADAGQAAESNEAAEALMQRALAAREQKKKETEEARRTASLSSGGLKKGFLSGGKAPKKAPRSGAEAGASSGKEAVPYISGAGDAEAARRESLKLPEVQQALQQGVKKLQSDQSWMTPQLMQALQSRPDLLKGMSNPRVQEAIRLMQADPEKAKAQYQDDPEVTSFLKEFSSLMATHFDVLGKESPASAPPAAPAVVPQAVAPAMGSPLAAGGEPMQFLDPQIASVLQDPEVQSLIASLRAGRPLEMHDLIRERPQLFQKIKMLLDNGLLSLQQ